LNFLAIGTFCQPKTREIGNGIYRLWISIIGQIGLIVLVSHILLEKTNHEIINCYILEYLGKVLHALYDSLTACTSLERTVVIYQGISFNKLDSRRMAKLIIPILIIYHFISILYQPFYHQIIFSFNRYWCIFQISNSLLRNYQSTINILHFILPYLINLILPIIWILTLTKSKLALHKNTSIWNNLKKVLSDYKHTIIANYILVLFNTPRFISIFYLTCIQYSWQNIAYLLSLIPFLINLFIFVLPSPKYRPELFNFIQSIVKYRYRSQYNVT
jgi:hypothetical protein